MALWKCLSNWYKLQAVQNVKKLLADLSAEELLLRLIVHELSAVHPGQPSGTYMSCLCLAWAVDPRARLSQAAITVCMEKIRLREQKEIPAISEGSM